MVRLRKYQVYDGDTLIGTLNCTEGEKLLGVARRRFAECARYGGKLKNRYTVALLDENPETTECREGFREEWRAATEVIQEKIGVEKMLLTLWDTAVRPFRRERCGIWRTQQCEKIEWNAGPPTAAR